MKTIQIQLDSGKQGPAPQGPMDFNTLLPVAFWRGEPVKIAVALFADPATVADVSGVAEISLEISPDAAHTTPVFAQTIDALDAEWDDTITKVDWEAGTARHALFSLAKGDLAPTMDGSQMRQLWMRVTMLDGGEWIVLANGTVSVHEAGAWPV